MTGWIIAPHRRFGGVIWCSPLTTSPGTPGHHLTSSCFVALLVILSVSKVVSSSSLERCGQPSSLVHASPLSTTHSTPTDAVRIAKGVQCSLYWSLDWCMRRASRRKLYKANAMDLHCLLRKLGSFSRELTGKINRVSERHGLLWRVGR